MSEFIGKRIGPYEILEVIGRGGMGVIYKGRDRGLDRVVALKFLPAASAMSDESRQRFLREARTLAKLEHPGIPSIYNVGKAGDSYYIACQFVEGRTLLDVLRERGSLSVMEALRIVREVADVLHATHAHGIIHRDIKTDNLMLDEAGRIKVLDFGLAKPIHGGVRITQGDVYLGTPEYCSPEQLRGEDLDGRSDLYSLGVVLYELISGDLPFSHEDTSNLYQRILKGKFQPLRKANPEVPEEVEDLVRCLLERRREHRIPNALEVRDRIDALLASADSEDESEPPRSSKRLVRRPALRRLRAFPLFFALAGSLLVPVAFFLRRLLGS